MDWICIIKQKSIMQWPYLLMNYGMQLRVKENILLRYIPGLWRRLIRDRYLVTIRYWHYRFPERHSETRVIFTGGYYSYSSLCVDSSWRIYICHRLLWMLWCHKGKLLYARSGEYLFLWFCCCGAIRKKLLYVRMVSTYFLWLCRCCAIRESFCMLRMVGTYFMIQ